MRVAIFGNTYKKENLNLLSTLFGVLHRKNASVYVEQAFYNFIIEYLDFLIFLLTKRLKSKCYSVKERIIAVN